MISQMTKLSDCHKLSEIWHNVLYKTWSDRSHVIVYINIRTYIQRFSFINMLVVEDIVGFVTRQRLMKT
jgi:hypothetical protein